jgi:hypothetical protein
MGRGIERRKIFLSDTDRNDFIDRLSALAQDGAMEIYAWVLRPIIFICFVKERVAEKYNVSIGELRSGGRRRAVVKARRAMSWIGVRELGYSGAEGTKRKTRNSPLRTRNPDQWEVP